VRDFAHTLPRKGWGQKETNLFPYAVGLRAAPGPPTRAAVARVAVEAKRSAHKESKEFSGRGYRLS
jgi:hypothetical protein